MLIPKLFTNEEYWDKQTFLSNLRNKHYTCEMIACSEPGITVTQYMFLHAHSVNMCTPSFPKKCLMNFYLYFFLCKVQRLLQMIIHN